MNEYVQSIEHTEAEKESLAKIADVIILAEPVTVLDFTPIAWSAESGGAGVFGDVKTEHCSDCARSRTIKGYSPYRVIIDEIAEHTT